MSVCEDTGLDTRGCAHCRGLTKVNLDSANVAVLELELDTSEVETAVQQVVQSIRRTDLDRLGRLLLQVAEVHAALQDMLAGTTSGGDGERVATTKVEAPLPVDTRVVDHRHLLVRGLRYWCARAGRPLTQPDQGRGETVPRMVAYLIARLPDLSAEDRAELRENLEDWRRGAGKVSAPPKVRSRLPLPTPCPNADGDMWQCPGTLDLLVPVDRDASPWLVCNQCAARLEVTELPEAGQVRLPVHVAADLLDVSVRTIQRRAGREAGMVRLADAMAAQ